MASIFSAPNSGLRIRPSFLTADSALKEIRQVQSCVRACHFQVTTFPSRDHRRDVETCAIALAIVKSTLEGVRDEKVQRRMGILERDYRGLVDRVACISRKQPAPLPPSLVPPSIGASLRTTRSLPPALPSMPPPVIIPGPTPKKEEGARTSSISRTVPLSAAPISTSSTTHSSLPRAALASSPSATPTTIAEKVARTFASISRKRGQGITVGKRIELCNIFNASAPVTVPTLLNQLKTGGVRPLLLGPKGQGYALMDNQGAGDPLINHGGFKELYHAVGLHDGENYAVAECDIAKVAVANRMTVSDVRAILQREQFFAEYLLREPSVINIPLVVEADGKFYFIMNLYRGGDFSQLLNNLRDSVVDPSFQHRVGHELLLALAATHAKDVIHRDLKPQNILLDEDLRAVLCDYGLATLAGDPDRLGAGRFVGTAAFWAPETVRGIPPASKAVDTWAMGIILYNLITLQPLPWQVHPKGQSSAVTKQNIPQDMSWKPSFPPPRHPLPAKEAGQKRELELIISDMLQIDPKRRPSIPDVLKRWDAVTNPLSK